MDANQARTQSLFRKLQKLPANILSDPNPGAVHQLRTTIRRVETSLVHHWGDLPRKERKLIKQLERIRKRAGKVRDLDVQIAALLGLKSESISRDKLRVMRVLEKNRIKRQQKLAAVLETELEKSLRKRLARARERLLAAPAQRSEDHRRRTSHVSIALGQFAALVEQYPGLKEQNLHDFRMGCKRVRYIAEMGENEPNGRRAIEQLRHIQDAVGEWHDWVTLIATAQKALARRPGSPLLPLLRTNMHAKFLQALDVVSAARSALLALRSESSPRKAPGSVASQGSAETTVRAASA